MLPVNSRGLFRAASSVLALFTVGHAAHAGPLRERILQYRLERQAEEADDAQPSAAPSLPAGVRVLRDVPYGQDRQQRMDVYLPSQAADAPVIFMVHGGAWRLGDKGASTVVDNKVSRWVPKGFILVSANYRLLPDAAPVEQAHDVARALAAAQAQAASWGGNPAKFIVMGHSAGAHLVALLAASPALALKVGAKPWLGTVLLDSAAFDVSSIMSTDHPPFYDRAFGSDPAYWKAASPLDALSETATPFLSVCSSRRDNSCPEARRFVAKAQSLKVRASLLEEDMTHRAINQRLGADGAYTEAVESFMGTLDEPVRRMLNR